MLVSTKSTYKVITFWFICYRLKMTKLSLQVDKTNDRDTWRLIPRKVKD
jgi:hypothetical protein